MNFNRIHFAPFICVLFLGVLFYWFQYELVRTNFPLLTSLIALQFMGYFYLLKTVQDEKILLGAGLFFRLILLFALPNLSQDFYRFIWDGRLFLNGMNPYIHLPNDLMQDATFNLSQKEELYAGMGSLSAKHYSNYPPINQLFFTIPALFSGSSILFSAIIMKITLLFADLGIVHFGKNILNHFNLNSKQIYLYFLNPFIIIELVGNLHFEGLMLFFFVLGIYFLVIKKWRIAAIFIGISVSVKLLPLLLLPLFFQRLGFWKSVQFYTIIIGLNLLLFLPFFRFDLIEKYSETIGLWFVNFEFNASLYYLIREVGFWVKGYNIIQSVGKVMPILFIIFILILSFFRKNKTILQILSACLLALSIYFFQSTTVHPWYIANLVLLTVFVGKFYPIAWSFLVMFSYSAYSINGFQENYWIIGIQYFIVYSLFIYEFIKPKKINILQLLIKT